MAGTASVNCNASKRELKEVKQYLENIDTNKVEKVYGVGQYTPWHGDRKSQSQTNITFQTKSQASSGKPTKYITIVARKKRSDAITIGARKKRSDAYVTYESTSWEEETTKSIIDTMIAAL